MRQVVEEPKCHARGRGLVQQATGEHCCPSGLLPGERFHRVPQRLIGSWGMEKKVLSNFLPSISQYLYFQNAIAFFSHKKDMICEKFNWHAEKAEFTISLLLIS